MPVHVRGFVVEQTTGEPSRCAVIWTKGVDSSREESLHRRTIRDVPSPCHAIPSKAHLGSSGQLRLAAGALVSSVE